MFRIALVIGLAIVVSLRSEAQGFIRTLQIPISASAVIQKVTLRDATDVYATGSYQGRTELGGMIIDSTSDEMFLARFDKQGRARWVVTAGGTGRDAGMDVALDAAGNVYVVGFFRETAQFGSKTVTIQPWKNYPTLGRDNLFIAKYTPAGDLLWVTGSEGELTGKGLGLTLDKNGNVFTTGTSTGAVDPETGLIDHGAQVTSDMWSSDGAHLWHQELTPGINTGTWPAQGKSIRADQIGNIYITGEFAHRLPFGGDILSTAGPAIFLGKISPKLEIVWGRQSYHPRGNGIGTFVNGMDLDDAGNPVIAGRFQGQVIFGDTLLTAEGWTAFSSGFLAKYDTNGNVLWATQIGARSHAVMGLALDQEGAAHLVSSEESSSNTYVSKYGRGGSAEWIFKVDLLEEKATYAGVFKSADKLFLMLSTRLSAGFGDLRFTNRAGGDLFIAEISEEVPPIVTGQPRSTTLSFRPGMSTILQIEARSVAPMSYQWMRNGSDIAGATNSSLSFTNAQISDQGDYWAVLSNSYGSVTSAPAKLRIYVPGRVKTEGGGVVLISPTPTNLFVAGETLTLRAVPDPGVVFLGWNGDATGTNNPQSFVAMTNFLISARFSDSLSNITMDTGEAIFAWQWLPFETSWKDAYNGDYRRVYARPGTNAAATATFRPTITIPGYYDVLIWYPMLTNNSQAAKWSVGTDAGTTNISVDQTKETGRWRLLMSNAYLSASTNNFVRLSDATGERSNRYIVADAVRFVAVRAPLFLGASVGSAGIVFRASGTPGIPTELQTSKDLINWMILTNVVSEPFWELNEGFETDRKFYRLLRK